MHHDTANSQLRFCGALCTPQDAGRARAEVTSLEEKKALLISCAPRMWVAPAPALRPAAPRALAIGALAMALAIECSGNRANSIYNRIFARSRTPKCAKLVLGASAVHVRSRQLCSRFFGVGIKKNEKRAILCVKGAYCELVGSSSSLDI